MWEPIVYSAMISSLHNRIHPPKMEVNPLTTAYWLPKWHGNKQLFRYFAYNFLCSFCFNMLANFMKLMTKLVR